MSEVKANLKYSKEHEWIEILDANRVKVGISAFAQHQLGDIVFVELPETGAEVVADDSMGTVESVKAVSDVYSPVSGKVLEANESLADAPETINTDPYEQGWIAIVELSNPAELDKLMSADEYGAFIEEE